MLDRYGRNIDYLRVSVTPYCNLRCIYCAPAVPDQPGWVPEDACHRPVSYLGAAEIASIIAAMAEHGIKKVRLTGGEPLLRPDILEIIAAAARCPGIEDLAMTTNGIGLAEQAAQLKAAGLKRVNVSIDSMDPVNFTAITGGGNLGRVIAGIQAALEAGLSPVKLNVVVMKGLNDGEIDDFIGYTKENPVEVRFIELMPIGRFGEDHTARMVPNGTIIADHPALVADQSVDASSTAKSFLMPGHLGRVGFISPISHQFCGRCNRIRLTADGKLKTCLGDNQEFDVAAVLRQEPEKLDWFVRQAIRRKPAGHHFAAGFVSQRTMTAIGG